jgi:hypothetical protein
VRDHIAVAFKTDRAVFVELAVDPPGGVECPLRQRLQMGPLKIEPLRNHFVGCPVNPLVFELEPLEKIPIGRFTAEKSVPPPEPLPNEVMGSLNLSLHPGGISGGNLRLESVMQCKSRQGVVELALAG